MPRLIDLAQVDVRAGQESPPSSDGEPTAKRLNPRPCNGEENGFGTDCGGWLAHATYQSTSLLSACPLPVAPLLSKASSANRLLRREVGGYTERGMITQHCRPQSI